MSAHYDVREAKDGAGWYVVLVYANGEDGPVSELYTRKEDAERAVGDIKAAAAEAAA